ncbi:MAG TPA: hypothetical protein VF437_08555 [Verrucomicrobiae bacterium]
MNRPSLNLDKASAVMYAADLTEEYVDFNTGDAPEKRLSSRLKKDCYLFPISGI